jgi:hypothetical protein
MPSPILGAAILAILLPSTALAHGEGRFSFAVWGDQPYSDVEYRFTTQRTVPDLNADEDLAFTVFIGDTKGGSAPCTDEALTSRARSFLDATRAPTVYLLGDNEWTDCHRRGAGGYDPLERLALLRAEFHSTPFALGERRLRVFRQSEAFPEHQIWVKGRVVFVGLHVVGSNNNKVNRNQAPTPTNPWPECLLSNSVRTESDCEAANAEYEARNAAAISWLREGFVLAHRIRARAVVVLAQAQPGFDVPETAANERQSADYDGFTDFLTELVAQARDFPGQILYAYGDDHTFRVHQPFSDPIEANWFEGKLVPNLTALQTYGSPYPYWVEVHVDTDSPGVFSFEPRIPR